VPLIDTLIDKRDNFEIVRDEIAAILLAETTSQQALAIAEALDPRLWKFDVYLERSNPWSDWIDLPATDANPADVTPIVNVWLNNLGFDMAASDIVERQKTTGTFHIDCYTYAPSSDALGGGHDPGDMRSALEVHRLVRLARNIMMAATHTYLGMQGLVWRRWISAIDIFQPDLASRQAQQIGAARITLLVDFNEFSPQVTGAALELISVNVKRAETGQIYFTADFPYPPET
jgi:hypothetical protein